MKRTAALVRPALSIVANRELVWEMAVRDLKGATQGAVLGHSWALFRPLVQTVAYVVIVCFVIRPGRMSGSALEYGTYVLSGVIPWQIVSRMLEESPSLIRNKLDLAKNVIYPIETLPMSALLGTIAGSGAALVVFTVLAVFGGAVKLSWLLLPLPLALLVIFVLGVSWIMMVAGVVVKDLREVVSLVLGLMVYVSPVVAREEFVGPRVWSVIQLNPLTHVVVSFRDVLTGTFHAASWAVFGAMALGAFLVGSAVIRKTKTLINEYL